MDQTSMEIESAKLSARERRASNQQRRLNKSIEKAAAANNRVQPGSTSSMNSFSQPSPFLRQALENQTRLACESQEDAMEWSSTQSDSQEDGYGMQDSYADQSPNHSFNPPINTLSPTSAPLGTPPSSPLAPYPALPPFSSFSSFSSSSSSSSATSTTYSASTTSSQSFPIRNRRHVVSRINFLASRQLPRPKGPTWKTKPGQGLRNYALVQPSDPWLYAYSSRSAKIEDGTVDMIDSPWRDDELGGEEEEYHESEWWTG